MDLTPDLKRPRRVKEAAEELNVSEQTLRAAIKQGEVRVTRLRKIILIPDTEMVRLKGEAA